MTEKYTCKIGKNISFEIKLHEDVFYPTGTSDELIKAVSKNIYSPGTVLDLGCGSGIVGFALNLLGKSKGTLYASDLSHIAKSLIEDNARELNIAVEYRQGSIFEPWKNERFDYIVNDISGISEKIAEISPWFDKTSCKSGDDGTDLVIEALHNSPLHLNNGGKFFFPVLSLSDSKKILEYANSIYQKVTLIGRKEWRLPEEMDDHIDLLLDLKEKGLISFEEKYGWMLWNTEIYSAEKPKKK